MRAVAASSVVLVSGCTLQLGGDGGRETPPASSSAPAQTAVGELAQWPSIAVATSRYGGDPAGKWGEDTLLGPPEVTQCADDPRAWAPQEKNTLESVILGYDVPVEATKLRVVENYNPGNISRIELLWDAPDAEPQVVYAAKTADVEVVVPGCPQIIEVTIPPLSRRVNTVLLEVDQRTVGDWVEIDAVELLGNPN